MTSAAPVLPGSRRSNFAPPQRDRRTAPPGRPPGWACTARPLPRARPLQQRWHPGGRYGSRPPGNVKNCQRPAVQRSNFHQGFLCKGLSKGRKKWIVSSSSCFQKSSNDGQYLRLDTGFHRVLARFSTTAHNFLRSRFSFRCFRVQALLG